MTELVRGIPDKCGLFNAEDSSDEKEDETINEEEEYSDDSCDNSGSFSDSDEPESKPKLGVSTMKSQKESDSFSSDDF